MHATETLAEAGRLMTICNSCRYCEGLCAMFPAMEQRRSFADTDLNYLANLCHACGACYDDCQFAPPHDFAVNVPATMAKLRRESYDAYVWPRAFSGVFARNGLVIATIGAAAVAAFIIGFVLIGNPEALFTAQTGPGAFYRVMPHNTMVAVFGAAFLYAIVATVIGLRRFWIDIASPSSPLVDRPALAGAGHDAATLRYLDGGGDGCADGEGAVKDRRKLYHHLTFYGFLFCFLSTSVASVWHYAFDRVAPYPWWDLPVVFGTLGGIGITIGPAGLLAAKFRRDPMLLDKGGLGMDVAFLAMLFLTGVTGLALLVLRATPAMGMLLAIHLGVVFALFITIPYGKFVHGLYRYLALVRHRQEQRTPA